MLLLIPQSGFVYYGGLLGLLSTLWIYAKKAKGDFSNISRFFAPAIPLFHFWGRIGCFMAGCCYGKDLSVPFEILYLSFDRIPVQIIEAIAEIILFGVLIIIEKKKPSANGMMMYLLCYAFIRFLDEFLRGDEIRGIFAGLSTSQWISIALIAIVTAKHVLYQFPGKKQTTYQ